MSEDKAREADMPLSRLVVELARADDPDRHALVLTETEQRAMRDELAECAELAPGAAGMRGVEPVRRPRPARR